MPVPYMGSKNKSARHIFNVIKAHTKNNTSNTLVDLFCGGFAISEEFLKQGYNTISNDKNKYVVALIKEAIQGLDEKKCLEWVSRKRFEDIITNPSKYEDWYVGYVMCIWSFGNNQKGYLFGKDIEESKKHFFKLVVDKEVSQFVKDNIPPKYIKGLLGLGDWHKRRLALKKIMTALKKRSDYGRIESSERLQSLEGLERLESNYLLSSGDYRDVEIPKNAIIYCDPPYKGTATYREGGFNHIEFWEWVRNISKTNKVFVSEYTAPDDISVLYDFPQKSCLQGGSQKHNNQPNEKLFTYKIKGK